MVPHVGRRFGISADELGCLELGTLRSRGLLTAKEASAVGLSDHGIAGLCRSGRWCRLTRGVYAVVGIDGGRFQPAQAELLTVGSGGVLHRRTAAAVHGDLDLEWDGRVDLATGPRGSGKWPRRRLPPAHIIEVDGLATTDVLFTVLDLARSLSDTSWEWALEAGLRSGATTIADIEAALKAPGRRDRVAAERVRRVLALRPDNAPPTESLLETRFVQLARRVHAPDAVRQLVVEDAEGMFVARVDFAYPELGVFIELDGQHHQNQPVYDSARQTAVVAATGWLPGRFTWSEVVQNPTPTGRRLLCLLDRAAERSLAG